MRGGGHAKVKKMKGCREFGDRFKYQDGHPRTAAEGREGVMPLGKSECLSVNPTLGNNECLSGSRQQRVALDNNPPLGSNEAKKRVPLGKSNVPLPPRCAWMCTATTSRTMCAPESVIVQSRPRKRLYFVGP